MKFKCPSCQCINKVKDYKKLNKNRNYLCPNCSKHLYANGSLFLFSTFSEFCFYALAAVFIWMPFFGASFLLPKSVGGGIQIAAGFVAVVIYAYLVEKLVNFIRLKVARIAYEA